MDILHTIVLNTYLNSLIINYIIKLAVIIYTTSITD